MNRKTKRELRESVDDLRENMGGAKEQLFAWRDPVTGDLEDGKGNPIDPDDHGADQLITITETLVMERERAERHDLTILGPHDGVPEGVDLVEVPDDESIELRDPRDGVTGA